MCFSAIKLPSLSRRVHSLCLTVWFLWRRVIYSNERAVPLPQSETQMKRNAKMKKPASPDKQREERSQRMAKELSWGDERCWWQCWWWEIIAGSSHQFETVFDTGSLSSFQLCIVGRCNPGRITKASSFIWPSPAGRRQCSWRPGRPCSFLPFTFNRGCSYRDRKEEVKRSCPLLGMLPPLFNADLFFSYCRSMYHQVSILNCYW